MGGGTNTRFARERFFSFLFPRYDLLSEKCSEGVGYTIKASPGATEGILGGEEGRKRAAI